MHKPDPKIIFFDVDDTLYIKDEKRIAQSTEKALHALGRKGIATAIATGRAPCLLPLVVRNLIEEAGIDMLVSINGQYVRYRGATLAEFPLPQDDVEETVRFLQSEHIAYGFVSSDHFHISHESPELLDATGALGLRFETDAKAYLRYPVYQMIAFYNEETGRRIEAHLPRSIRSVRWHPNGVDLLAADGSKARGIQAALDKLGLAMEDAMAFGDGLNDIEMMRSVGFGVAMGNAEPQTRAAADYVCPAVTQDGVYRGLVELGVIEEMD